MMWTWLFLTPVYPGSRTNCEKGICNQQPKSYTWILTPVIITPAGKKKWKYRFNPHRDSTIFHQSDLALDKRVKLNQGGQKMLSHIELRWLMRQDYSRSFESHHCILCLVFFKKREREKKRKKVGVEEGTLDTHNVQSKLSDPILFCRTIFYGVEGFISFVYGICEISSKAIGLWISNSKLPKRIRTTTKAY